MNKIEKSTLKFFCPFCATKLLDGIEATGMHVTCKRCKTKLTVSFNTTKINIDILNSMQLIADTNST